MLGFFDFSRERIMGILLMIPIMLIALPVHEMAHAWAAHKLGDPTARNFGRLSLNPMKHFDPLGFLCMLFFRIGWAKPVPINARNFKKPRRDMALSALAGPVSNLLLGFLGVLLLNIAELIFFNLGAVSEKTLMIMDVTAIFFYLFAITNINLAIFNFIPIPPFDGSRILYVFLPTKLYFGVMKYERYIMIAILVLFWTGTLTGPLSFLSGLMLNGMDKLIHLIPIF